MNFFIWRKNNVLFSRYRDFCVFVKPTDFKICDIIISIAAQCKLDLCFFLLNPKSYQNEIWSNASVLYGKYFEHGLGWMLEARNQFQALWWFDQNDNTARSGHFQWLTYTVFNCPLFTFSKNETLKSWHIWLLSNMGRLPNWKGSGI